MGEQRLSGAFDIHRILFSVEAPASLFAFFEQAQHFWSFLQVPPTQPPRIRIVLHSPAVWTAVDILRDDRAPIFLGPVKLHYTDSGFVLTEPGAVIVAADDRIDAYIDAAAGPDPRSFVHFSLNLALIEMLRRHRLYYVHAACLANPAGKTYLIAADSGHGKSTLTTALLAEGYRYLNDDAVFIDMRTSPRVVGYPKRFHLGLDLVARFEPLRRLPEVAPYGGGKFEVDPERIFPGRRLRGVERVDVILLPEIGAGATEIRSVGSGELLTALFVASAQLFFDRRLAAAHLEALKRVLGSARGYRLIAGPDVYAEPHRYHPLIDSL